MDIAAESLSFRGPMPPDRPPTAPVAPSDGAPDPTPLVEALRRTRRSVFVLLACSAGAIVLGGFAGDEPPPDAVTTTAAIGLGLGTIVLRQLGGSPVIGARTRMFLLVGSLVCAGALGLLGVFVAWSAGGARTGILFTLAGVIFAARPHAPALRAR